MAEIQPDELSEVRSFLAESFGLEREPAEHDAVIALLLSDEDRFAAALEKVDNWLAAIFEEANRQGLFEQRYDESDVRPEKRAASMSPAGFSTRRPIRWAGARAAAW